MKIQLKENIACYWLLFGRDSEYWPVIWLFSTVIAGATILAFGNWGKTHCVWYCDPTTWLEFYVLAASFCGVAFR
jgi:hypothetical protein